jgi:hypothetical protein
MAGCEIDRMPVVARDDDSTIVGFISLTMLLAARLRDLREARDAERVLRLRVVRPRWLAGRPVAAPGDEMPDQVRTTGNESRP